MNIDEIREKIIRLEREPYNPDMIVFYAKSPDYIRFLLSEVERLEKQNALHNEYCGATSCANCVIPNLALKDKIKVLEKENADYYRIVGEVLKCNPIPACKRSDNTLEPPWEVIARIRKENARLREELSNLKDIEGEK